MVQSDDDAASLRRLNRREAEVEDSPGLTGRFKDGAIQWIEGPSGAYSTTTNGGNITTIRAEVGLALVVAKYDEQGVLDAIKSGGTALVFSHSTDGLLLRVL